MEKNRNPTRDARLVLAENLNWLMQTTPGMKTQVDVSAKTKGGISQAAVSSMLAPARTKIDPKTGAEYKLNPQLDKIECVAAAFGLAAWQLLLDKQMVGEELAALLMRPRAARPEDPSDPPTDQIPSFKREKATA